VELLGLRQRVLAVSEIEKLWANGVGKSLEHANKGLLTDAKFYLSKRSCLACATEFYEATNAQCVKCPKCGVTVCEE
jgi:predicted Zn-ribbon and HTH transcriptional regulator